ncbi:MAG TPA: NADH-quinone oxidoreductase subunit M [Chthoniobacteraceae bacterium]|jgi:NADH-quinone oxidoreductase subunit M|nr:NADH-quinone oxidoreductase subunit M [Chthoniobacteraceae bacterium]
MAGLILILIPLIGALAVTALPQKVSRGLALCFTAAAGAAALCILGRFDSAAGGLQMILRHAWIPAIGAEFFLGIDGLSLLLLLLTAIIIPFGLFAGNRDRAFCALMLVLESALFGTFTAQNFILWFLFYEMSLLPAFLLIRNWGDENSTRAATKFFIFTFAGSAVMLLGFLAIYLHAGTFDFVQLAALGRRGILSGPLAWVAFIGICFGLAVKVPLFPLHTWLPDAYASAPTGVTMVLTGVLSKMGVYGFARLVLPLFPNELRAASPWLLGLAVCSIVLSALAAWAQTDLKRMIAYLSVNHLGYCMLGFFAVAAAGSGRSHADVQAALSGVFMQIFNHGITAAALFYFAGMLERRFGRRGVEDFGGLMQSAPVFCALMSVAIFSSLGLPGLNGFIGEFLIFKGAFGLSALASSVATLGLLFTAVTFLRAMQALFSGPVNARSGGFGEMAAGDLVVSAPLCLLMLGVGMAPQFLLNIFNATVLQLSRIFT